MLNTETIHTKGGKKADSECCIYILVHKQNYKERVLIWDWGQMTGVGGKIHTHIHRYTHTNTHWRFHIGDMGGKAGYSFLPWSIILWQAWIGSLGFLVAKTKGSKCPIIKVSPHTLSTYEIYFYIPLLKTNDKAKPRVKGENTVWHLDWQGASRNLESATRESTLPFQWEVVWRFRGCYTFRQDLLYMISIKFEEAHKFL